jgi:hypothetical protein
VIDPRNTSGGEHSLHFLSRLCMLLADALARRLRSRCRYLGGEGAELLEHGIAHRLGRGRWSHRLPARLDRGRTTEGRLEGLLRMGGDSARGLELPGENGGGPVDTRFKTKEPL